MEKNIEKFVYFRSKKYGSLQFDEIFDKNSLGFSLKLVGTPLVVSARFLVHFSRSA